MHGVDADAKVGLLAVVASTVPASDLQHGCCLLPGWLHHWQGNFSRWPCDV